LPKEALLNATEIILSTYLWCALILHNN
jgi:hypothetical protein